MSALEHQGLSQALLLARTTVTVIACAFWLACVRHERAHKQLHVR